MPRRAREYADTDTTRALDAVVAEYDEAEQRLKGLGDKLKAAVIEAAKEAAEKDSKLTITEIARRVGWTREYVSRIATEAGVRQREASPRSTAVRMPRPKTTPKR